MDQTNQGVNEEEAILDPAQDQEEQFEEQAESDIQPNDGKDWKAVAEQMSRDLKEKNQKIKELKSHNQNPSTVSSDEDSQKRFIRAEANATMALKLQIDPSFKSRVDIVRNYVEQGYDIDMADKLAKSDIMDQMLKASSPEPVQSITQLNPTAAPERQARKTTGNALDDFMQGNIPAEIENAQALREVLAKYRKA
jgi:hypothetical protein